MCRSTSCITAYCPRRSSRDNNHVLRQMWLGERYRWLQFSRNSNGLDANMLSTKRVDDKLAWLLNRLVFWGWRSPKICSLIKRHYKRQWSKWTWLIDNHESGTVHAAVLYSLNSDLTLFYLPTSLVDRTAVTTIHSKVVKKYVIRPDGSRMGNMKKSIKNEIPSS